MKAGKEPKYDRNCTHHILIVAALFIFYLLFHKNNGINRPEFSDDERLNQMYIDIEAGFDHPTTQEFKNAFQSFIANTEKGDNGSAHMSAEVFATVAPYRDTEKAYFWYYVYFAGQGYSMDFDIQEASNRHYHGKTVDFRNESMVAELYDELGFEIAKNIEAKARAFILSMEKQE